MTLREVAAVVVPSVLAVSVVGLVCFAFGCIAGIVGHGEDSI